MTKDREWFYDSAAHKYRPADVSEDGTATWEDGTPVPEDADHWAPSPRQKQRRAKVEWEWSRLWPKSVYERLKGKKLKPESAFFVGEDAVKVKHRSHP